MFIQPYGIYYFGKRLPVQWSEEVLAEVEGGAKTSFTRIFFAYIEAAAEVLAGLKPKIVDKLVQGAGVVYSKTQRRMSIVTFAGVDIITKTIKGITLIPIAVAEGISASIKKKAQKVVAAALSIFSLMSRRKVYEFEFFGDFAPGDVIKIDSKTMTITLNGTNVLHLVGRDDFPTILPGENELVYMDEEGERIVRVRIQWKDRWL